MKKALSFTLLTFLVGCSGSSHDLTITDKLCDGGIATYEISGQATNSSLALAEQCPSATLTIQDELCDGGTLSFSVLDSDGGILQVQQPCGSSAQTTIIGPETCVDAGPGTTAATFSLPQSFSAAAGDSLFEVRCSPSCGDAGSFCEAPQPLAPPPTGVSVVQVYCQNGAIHNPCLGGEVFLNVLY